MNKETWVWTERAKFIGNVLCGLGFVGAYWLALVLLFG